MSVDVVTTALDMIYPKSDSVETEIESEITSFLEQMIDSAPEEDAIIIRNELRKSIISFKNRSFLFSQRQAVEQFFDEKDEKVTRFLSGSHGIIESLEDLGLSNNDVKNLFDALRYAEEFTSKITSIPLPFTC